MTSLTQIKITLGLHTVPYLRAIEEMLWLVVGGPPLLHVTLNVYHLVLRGDPTGQEALVSCPTADKIPGTPCKGQSLTAVHCYKLS
jgi:hypothetical protein